MLRECETRKSSWITVSGAFLLPFLLPFLPFFTSFLFSIPCPFSPHKYFPSPPPSPPPPSPPPSPPPFPPLLASFSSLFCFPPPLWHVARLQNPFMHYLLQFSVPLFGWNDAVRVFQSARFLAPSRCCAWNHCKIGYVIEIFIAVDEVNKRKKTRDFFWLKPA